MRHTHEPEPLVEALRSVHAWLGADHESSGTHRGFVRSIDARLDEVCTNPFTPAMWRDREEPKLHFICARELGERIFGGEEQD